MSSGPRTTLADIESHIRSENYFTAYEGVLGERFHHEGEDDNDKDEAPIDQELKLLTICVMVLQNGYTVIGTSACASAENYNKEMGQKIAREKTIEAIWPLMGYQLRNRLYFMKASAPSKGGEADRQDEGHDAVGTGQAEANLVENLEHAAENTETLEKLSRGEEA